jgi:hypothetical protein
MDEMSEDIVSRLLGHARAVDNSAAVAEPKGGNRALMFVRMGRGNV